MASTTATAALRPLPSFRLGTKQVFLSPNHVITFLRKEHLPPNEACFKVPLRFTKLDLRDYLWNLYNVEVRKVRSYVKQQPLARRHSYSSSWYRPLPLKIMTVELAKPFQWPDLPADLEPWSNELWKARAEHEEKRSEEQVDMQQFKIPLQSQQPLSKERKDLASLAKKMLSGEVKWKNDVVLDPRWDRLLAENRQPQAGTASESVANKGQAKEGHPTEPASR